MPRSCREASAPLVDVESRRSRLPTNDPPPRESEPCIGRMGRLCQDRVTPQRMKPRPAPLLPQSQGQGPIARGSTDPRRHPTSHGRRRRHRTGGKQADGTSRLQFSTQASPNRPRTQWETAPPRQWSRVWSPHTSPVTRSVPSLGEMIDPFSPKQTSRPWKESLTDTAQQQPRRVGRRPAPHDRPPRRVNAPQRTRFGRRSRRAPSDRRAPQRAGRPCPRRWGAMASACSSGLYEHTTRTSLTCQVSCYGDASQGIPMQRRQLSKPDGGKATGGQGRPPTRPRRPAPPARGRRPAVDQAAGANPELSEAGCAFRPPPVRKSR